MDPDILSERGPSGNLRLPSLAYGMGKEGLRARDQEPGETDPGAQEGPGLAAHRPEPFGASPSPIPEVVRVPGRHADSPLRYGGHEGPAGTRKPTMEVQRQASSKREVGSAPA
jgi:hypothetical protein